MSDSLEWLSKDKNLIIAIIAVFLVTSTIVFFFYFIKEKRVWGMVTGDYFIPREDLIPGRSLSSVSSSSIEGEIPQQCKKTKRAYGYSWSSAPKLESFCYGSILEFNNINDSLECFDSITQKFKEMNATEQSIIIGNQEVKNITSHFPIFLWTKNRFLFLFYNNNLGCNEFRNNIINNITSKYPFF